MSRRQLQLLNAKRFCLLAIFSIYRTTNAESVLQDSKAAANHGSPAAERQIFVGGFNAQVNYRHLESHFSQFGPVERAIVFPGRRFGFVTFSDVQSVTKALVEPVQFICGGRADVRRFDKKGSVLFAYIFSHSILIFVTSLDGEGGLGGTLEGIGTLRRAHLFPSFDHKVALSFVPC